MSFSRWLTWSIPLLLANEALATTLVPIRPYSRQQNKRQESSGLDLKSNETFLWGTSDAIDNALAALTVQFPGETENVLAMEHFDDMVTSITCSDSSIEMTFEDDATFAYAQRVWDWVNGADNHSFVMVAGPGNCGTNQERIPFVVSTLQFDEEANKATLGAATSNWTTIAHTYDLTVGSTTSQNPTASTVISRDIDKDISIDFSHNLNGTLSIASGDASASVTCLDCSTKGSFDLYFKISQVLSVPTGASVTFRPNGVSAIAKVKLDGSGEVNSINKTIELVSVPLGALEVPGIFELGPYFTVSLGAFLNAIDITAGVMTGVTGAISDDAVVHVDLLNWNDNEFSGWVPTVDVVETDVDAMISGSAEVYLEESLELKANALGFGFRIGLDLQLPVIKATLSTEISTTDEVCEGSDQIAGVNVSLSIGGNLGLNGYLENDKTNPFLDLTLAEFEAPLVDSCFPFGSNVTKRSIKHPHMARFLDMA